MEKIAFIRGETFIYWSPIVMVLAAVAAIAIYAAFYTKRDGNVFAMSVSVLLAVILSFPLSRLIHWYCRTSSYGSLYSAMTDYSVGGYALIGVFAGCLLSAAICRVFFLSASLPRMLDSMALGGGVGIALGRLASLFNSSDRGMIVSNEIGLPFAYATTNSVSGAVENRLATFMIQSILTGGIVVLLVVYLLVSLLRKKKVRDGDIFLLFSMLYGSCQIVCDSTRYDQLFFRSNGFVSVVQILSLVALLIPLIIFSVRMVLNNRFRVWYLAIWIPMLGMMGLAGYMEYYVQRHGTEAAFAYSVMSACLIGINVLGLVTRGIKLNKNRS